ncbi:MAG TPA: bacteriohopanetetrol glucosamine biosynthesis glycosyltransferase HpnI [Thermoanaerobaculia bacterium]|nr:bacteriohopanetetrol glucosamine biosynthesis glycosyltransferase HpnI [Thermoanaerobaculia bacterium]
MIAVEIVAFVGLAISIAYTLFAVVRVAGSGRAVPAKSGGEPTQSLSGMRPHSITIAKPLCGIEPGLRENLLSFCRQDYPDYEVIFGVRDAGDPAVAVVRQVMSECGNQNVSLVIEPRVSGSNLKISNVLAIERKAKHDLFIVADSDMRVGPDYLHAVASCFDDERVGAATCLYAARPAPGLASALAAMHINDEFFPSVLVSLALQPLAFCFGATMAVRRSALDRAGGFRALADYLADDYMLGNVIHGLGMKVALAPYVVDAIVAERNVHGVFLHELRWGRTIRAVRPVSYAFSVLTMLLPWAVAFLLASRFATAGWIALGAAVALRIVLHLAVRARLQLSGVVSLFLIPLRDTFNFCVFCATWFGRNVLWRETRFSVSSSGELHQEGLAR